MTLFLRLLLIILPLASAGQSSFTGQVMDWETGEVLAGATIKANGREVGQTNADGGFRVTFSEGDSVQLIITHVGYFAHQLNLRPRHGTTVLVGMVAATSSGNEVVVTASARVERLKDAPASIQVLNRVAFDRFAGSNPVELLRNLPGVEFTRSGIDEITINARGLHSAFNNRLLQLVDGRISAAALSGNLPVMNRGTVIKEDIERVEVVLGPQSALYGPNALNAVFNTITRDPKTSEGTTLAWSVGTREQFSGRLRHAAVINNRWRYKLSGEHAVGKEFRFYDSVFAGNQAGNTPFYGPPVTIPEHNVNFNFRHSRGEGHLYYTLGSTDLILSAGSSLNEYLQITTGGHNQMRGVTYSFLQIRAVHERWTANLYETWGNIGNSYTIGGYTRDFWNRTHSSLPSSDPVRGRLSPDSAEAFALRNMFKEKSRRLNGDVMYRQQWTVPGLYLAAGLNYQEELPNGYGINLIDSFQQIRVRQWGGVLQVDKRLPWNTKLVTAARFDHHQNFGSYISPRIALVHSIKGGSVRVGWARSIAMPTIQNQYAGIGRNFFGNSAGIRYLPNNRRINDESAVMTTIPLKVEKLHTWEAGMRMAPVKGLFLDLSGYYGTSKDFVSPPRSVGGRVQTVNGITVTHNPNTAGIVVNDTLKNASFSTVFNYGEVTSYGIDLGARYNFSTSLSLALSYSWFDSDITKETAKNDANRDGYVSLEERSLNAPNHRGSLTLSYDAMARKRLMASLTARFVEQYEFYSGSQIGTIGGNGKRGVVYGGPDPVTGTPRNYLKGIDFGPLGGFVSLDLQAGYQYSPNLRMNLGITNLLDGEQVEFVSAPSIGRLVMVEIKVTVPPFKKGKL